jgi:4-alpha-glucanotransferase
VSDQHSLLRPLTRHVGINVPLFSLRSTHGWGIGELPDLRPLADWLAASGMDRVLLLPLGTMQPGQTSPYASTSTLAIDPIYIRMAAVPDFERAGGLAALTPGACEAIERARASAAVDYEAVRLAKAEALTLAFRQFAAEDWARMTPRASELAAYAARERWWLDDYALFQALSEACGSPNWRAWDPALRDRDLRALEEARRQAGQAVLEHQYYQWVAEQQWQEARQQARARGVRVYGDLPFVAGMDSPEIWARADEYMLEVSAGVPPDAFSPTGQDWGLPTYRWETIRQGDYAWLHQRARRMASLYDGLRVDHTIGLYRTYGRPHAGEPFYTPRDEPTQIAQGEEVMRILLATGLELVAEDLGSVPDFLRDSLGRLGVPGCKVLRWERRWKEAAEPFIPPETFDPLSAAMTGTHDTEPLSVWWAELRPADRAALLALPFLQSQNVIGVADAWTDTLRDLLVEQAYRAGSTDLFFPIQDVFGWPDRINVPGTVGGHNWTWSLPWPIDQAPAVIEAVERAAFLRALARRTSRGLVEP